MKILLVYADDEAGPEMTSELERWGYEVRWVPDASDEHVGVRDATPSAIVGCVEGNADTGLEAVRQLKSHKLYRSVPVLFTGQDGPALEEALAAFPKASFARRDALQTALASLSA